MKREETALTDSMFPNSSPLFISSSGVGSSTLNYHSGGATWRDNGVVEEQVIRRNQHIEDGAPALWRYAEQMIERAVDEGKLER
jgi:hypothetical protein